MNKGMSNPNRGKTYKDFYQLIVALLGLLTFGNLVVPPFMYILMTSVFSLWVLFSPNLQQFSQTNKIVFVLASAYIAASFSFMFFSAINSIYDITAKQIFHKKQQKGVSPLQFHYTLDNAILEGHIYLVRRFSDGIYKIGSSLRFEKRFRELTREYGAIHLIALWETPKLKASEKYALQITNSFLYKEYGHQELRCMADKQALDFISHMSHYISEMDVTNSSLSTNANFEAILEQTKEPNEEEKKVIELIKSNISRREITKEIWGNHGDFYNKRIDEIVETFGISDENKISDME